jgi:very-short-patch-repair endonuclease
VRRLTRRLKDEFNHRSADTAHKQLDKLRASETFFREAIQELLAANIRDQMEKNLAFYQFINGIFFDIEKINAIQESLADLRSILSEDDDGIFVDFGLSNLTLREDVLDGHSILSERIKSLSEHFQSFDYIRERFTSIPEVDYADELRDIAELQTQRLADNLDARVVEFANTKKNKAAQIKTIIKKKQKFPRDLFEDLREAFPVMIAGIRDYAEYVPLERDIFDLIIIDEASQVSIAQALPAFIRAKKVLVLGDRNQFSNVKTSNASKAINQSYQARILEQFRQQAQPNISMLNQIKMFDIRTSVLEFVERIANLKIMLKKHFRGYPELIGFSSRYFYSSGLQAMKIRGRPIDEVIKIIPIEHDGKHELAGNTNQIEAAAIIHRLRHLCELPSNPDVCIITPFNEQQRLILQELQKISDGQEMIEKLRLRIFTFDTCQGEEADICIYSMVATPLKDRLNYIFAKEISKSDDVEESIRLQRLNVGFSRAKECVEIYHSKDISEMGGGIRVALSHFQNELIKGRQGPETTDVDPQSPMELQVLNWLRAVPLFDELGDQVEVDAQFELGAYLKQLNPSYQHPNYKVDFLVKVVGNRETAQIIIEYDGFKEHFTNLDEVDASNYEYYMNSEDVERQKILEGYGYKFLRINRFTIGKDPVKTLDERLRKMLVKFDIEREPPSLIEEHMKLQKSLNDGDSKACSRCNDIKPIEDYFDQTLSNGAGGYGRICTECKSSDDYKPHRKKMPTKRGSQKNKANTGQEGKADGRTYLNCPYSDKEECKNLGGKWDAFKKKWYVPAGRDVTAFSRWL